MQFRVLGPLEVVDGERPLKLAGAKQRALLALLLLSANEVVFRDALIEGLWGERPPAGAAHSLEAHVSRLRKLLHSNGQDLLLTRPGGYVLSIPDGEIDLVRFQQLAEEGHAALRDGEHDRAAELLRDALSLWRGPPLEDLAFEPFAAPEIRELEDRRLAAYEDLFEAELALGHHAEVLPELERLARLNPLRERLQAALMLALYRSGRQADALDAYRNARRHFADELGIEPGPELRELEQAILRQDDHLASPVPSVESREDKPQAEPEAELGRRQRLWPLLVCAALAIAGGTAAIVLLTRGSSESVAVAANSVAVIDPKTNEVVGDISDVGSDPNKVAVDKSGVWVTSRRDQLLTRIDPRTKQRSFTRGLAVTPVDLGAGARAVWIAGGRGGQVIRFDVQSESPSTIQLAGKSPSADWLYVAHGSVWVYDKTQGFVRIDPTTSLAGRPVGSDGGPFVVRDGTAWYVPAGNAYPPPNLGHVNLTTATSGMPVRLADTPIALANGVNRVWVTVPGSLFPINTTTTIAEPGTRVGSQPVSVAVGAGSVWVANAGTHGTISRVSPLTGEVKTIDLPHSPIGVAVGEGFVWVAVSSQ